MKDYNEMANSVFHRRDEFVAARKKRNGRLLKAGTSVCALLLVAVVGVSVWRALPHIPSVKPTEPTTTVSADTTEDTAQTQEKETTVLQADLIETPDKTEGKEDTKAETPQVKETKPQATKKPAVATDPTESKPAGSNDTPQTGETLPPDPTEPKGDKPATDGTPDPTAATDAPSTVAPPADAPQAPGADSVKPTLPVWTPESPETPPTDAWEDPEGTTCLPMAPEPTTAVCDEPTEPTIGDLEPTLPTEPATGPLFIECDGKTYEAQTGDMVTLTVELQAEKEIKSAVITTKYDYYYGRLEVVNLKDLGFTEKQIREAHLPNIGEVTAFVSYNSDSYGRYKGVRVDASVVEAEDSMDFTEKKVLYTFSFLVKKPGNTSIEFMITDIIDKDGQDYYQNSVQVIEGANLFANLTVIPAEQVVLPTPPETPEKEEDVTFAYPEESFDGDLIISCDGRTYSANVGDTVNFVAQMKADELFENIHIVLDYPEEYLKLNTPEKAKHAFPNMYGMTVNFLGYKEFPSEIVINPAVIMVANDIYGYDFTSRQVLVTLEFEVIKAGEIDLDLHFEDMFKYSPSAKGEAYFDAGVQKSFDDIAIYEYVIVNKD